MEHALRIRPVFCPVILAPPTRGARPLEPSQHSDHHETMTVELQCDFHASTDFDVVDDARRGHAM